MSLNPALLASAVGLCLIVAPHAKAAGIPFTFDSSLANPSLGGGSFTADDITTVNYLHSIVMGDGSFAEHLIDPITGFSLGGAPVSVPGLNSSFGLYLSVDATGTIVAGKTTYSMLDISLMADVGNNDGTPSATLGTASAPGTLAFSNPTGVADDIVLGSGSLLSASMSLDAAGTRHATYLDTFDAAPDESGFYVSPTPFTHLQIEELLTTLPSAFTQSAPDSTGRSEIAVNGGGGEAIFAVPEPSTWSMIAVGGVALLGIMHRNRRTA